MTFTVTEEHIKLLRAAVVRWEDCEFGAPAIDCKRPYGNSSVYEDVAEILYGINHDSETEFREDEIAHMDKVHAETETALQIFLVTGKMEAGEYVLADRYGKDWQKA